MIQTLSGRQLRWPALPADPQDDLVPPPFEDAAYYALGRAVVFDLVPAYSYALAGGTLTLAEAIVEWVARHFMHPDQKFHQPCPAGTRREQMPVGAERAAIWTQVSPRTTADNEHYGPMTPQAILSESLGTWNGVAGSGAAWGSDGLMERVSAGRWRIRSLATYRTAQCTLQHRVARYLLHSQGILALWGNTNAHDPLAVYVPSLNGWAWIDATYDEIMETPDGARVLGPVECLRRAEAARAAGRTAPVMRGRKLRPPTYAALPFLDLYDASNTFTARSPGGLGPTLYGLQLNESPATVGLRFRQIDCRGYWASSLAGNPTYPARPESVAVPHLGLWVSGVEVSGTGLRYRVEPPVWYPDAVIERSVAGGVWLRCGSEQYTAAGAGALAFRAVAADTGELYAAETLVV